MKSKFKAGDLVELSAAGQKAQQNMECYGGFGFIETIILVDQHGRTQAYPIKCKWWKKDLEVINVNFKPYELKYFKNK